MPRIKQTDRTRLKRLPNRGHFDTATIYEIIDAALVAHVGIIHGDTPVVIPTICARKGDVLYIHGSAASRLLKSINSGGDICVTITHVDGLVLARSAFHHSLNYRSVVFFGKGRLVSDEEERLEALKVISDHLVWGRWDDVRPPNEKELKQTTVLAIPIDEASAKIRTGPPGDDDEDYALPVWAGIIPIRNAYGEPERDGQLPDDIPLPSYINRLLNK